MVEAPLELQKSLAVPEDHWQACRDANAPYQGNAAANTNNLLDLTGANVPPPGLPPGFTVRGVVALVFSVSSPFVGVAVIAWYGSAPLGKSELASARKKIQSAGMPVVGQ